MVSQCDDAESEVFSAHLGAQTSSGPFHHQWHQHFKVEGKHKFRWGRQTSQDSLRPGMCHHLLVSYEVPRRCFLRGQNTNCTLVYFPRFDFYPLDSHVCKLRLSTNFDDSQIELRYCIVRWLRKTMLVCRTIFREFNSIRAWNPITGFKLALTREQV